MMKVYRTVPVDEVIGTFSAERRARIKVRAAELISEELRLLDSRKSKT